MTSAAELFYTRRSRVGRPDPDSGIGSSIERIYHRRNHLSHHNNRHESDGSDSLRRSSHGRHFNSRGSSLSERPSVRFEEGISELVSSNGLNADIVNSSRRQSLRSNERHARGRFDEGTSELVSSNGLNADGVSNVSRRSLSSDERLPGAVLLARARLLERLRGVSVSANRGVSVSANRPTAVFGAFYPVESVIGLASLITTMFSPTAGASYAVILVVPISNVTTTMTIQTTSAPTSFTYQIIITGCTWHSIMHTFMLDLALSNRFVKYKLLFKCFVHHGLILFPFWFRFLPFIFFRRSSRTPPNGYRREYVLGDDLRTVSEITTGLEARSSPLTPETERFQLLHETSKKPPGLTQEAVDRLPLEVFSSQEVDVEKKASRESRDCSICLESFGEEDVLTRLPCGHRFHFACLDPWVRTCGDCPYCRRSIP